LFGDRLARAQQERIRAGGVPNRFRIPYGPGWVLVGDAGYLVDPVTAQGITDAFHDAELCATAIDTALSGDHSHAYAMAEYRRQRAARVGPMYDFTTQLATLEPPPPALQQLLGLVVDNQAAMDEFASRFAGTMAARRVLRGDSRRSAR
jgi:flavin-dependent dehydrogenase